MILRILIGLTGLAACLVALRIWMAPDEVAARLGLAAASPLGAATLRADFAGFFAAGGVFSIWAAARDARRLLTPPLLLIGCALAGRLLTLALGPQTPDMAAPMAIEGALVVLLAIGRRWLGEGGAHASAAA